MMIIRHRQERDAIQQLYLAHRRPKKTLELNPMSEVEMLDALKKARAENQPDFILWAVAMGASLMLSQMRSSATPLDRDDYARLRKLAIILYDKVKSKASLS